MLKKQLGRGRRAHILKTARKTILSYNKKPMLKNRPRSVVWGLALESYADYLGPLRERKLHFLRKNLAGVVDNVFATNAKYEESTDLGFWGADNG